jgi:hypothetical protein
MTPDPLSNTPGVRFHWRPSDSKFYVRGIGMVLALVISGGSDREELVEYKQ